MPQFFRISICKKCETRLSITDHGQVTDERIQEVITEEPECDHVEHSRYILDGNPHFTIYYSDDTCIGC